MAVVYRYHTAWAGSTLLIFMKGQCESLMIGIGARETYSHVFFCFQKVWLFLKNGEYDRQGSAGQAALCPVVCATQAQPSPLNRKNKVFIFKHF